MITPLLVFKLTIVLTAAALGLWFCRGLNAGVRNRLCTGAIIVALLLPFLHTLSVAIEVPIPALFSFGARPAATPIHAFHVPWNGIWLVGLLLLALRSIAGLVYLAVRSRRARPYRVLDAALLAELNAVGASVRLASVPAPLVWGWLKPVILLPESAESWPQERIRLGLLHELAHVHRRDLWTSLLWIAARAIYWFHPLVWWLSARARADQELACDARVLASGAAPAEYAGFLVDIARDVHSPAMFGCAMVTNTNLLRGRVMHILQFRPGSFSVKGLAGLLVSVGLIAGAGFVALAKYDHPDATANQHVYKIGGDVSAPRIIQKFEPEYTQSAKEKKVQGSVLLALVIDASGNPKDIRVLRSLDQGLDENAITAVSQWDFAPAMKEGKPVAVDAKVEINFRLK